MNKIRITDNILYFAMAVIFIISSFDRFLVLRLFGFSFRYVYLVLFALLALSLLNLRFNIFGVLKNIFSLSGSKYLVIWTIFVLLFIPNTSYLNRNIGYALSLIMNLSFIFVFVYFIDEERKFNKIFELYIYSFSLIALCGWGQLILVKYLNVPLFIDFYRGVYRISAFSYEPSYFATYLFIGLVLSCRLLLEQQSIIKKSVLIFNSLFLLATLLRTTSKLIYLMIIIYVLYLIFTVIFSKASKRKTVFIMLAVLAVLAGIGFYFFQANSVFIMAPLQAPDGSFNLRFTRMADVWNVFTASPFIGHSLGGVATEIAKNYGVAISSNLDVKAYEGMNVFLEILVAVGIIGFVFFILFVVKMVLGLYKSASVIGKALAEAFVFQLILLSMNQNILRAYEWVLLGMCFSFLAVRKSEHLSQANDRQSAIIVL